MKAETGRWPAFGRKAAVAALLAAPLAASAATGGVIRFVGMVVAPQLEISADAVPTVASAGGAAVAGQGLARTVTFGASPGVGGGVDVALEVNGDARSRDLVAARFVDGGGRVTAARDGRYDVGQLGGVLSLSAQRADVDTRVTVVVSYE
ncbi:hypothetical protein G3N58_08570 [Paraburkholderia sp. Ac-20342]|uniref:hypothetical protein n=1 Tax=unclassified Paraburkholderia TaxID=2615204 RepID=UPI00141DCE22|nr:MULTISPECIES: hypothetical protein [unclassified Paraburkholderia]MBN3846880.1 hypothetical protein [Paraburkholderia sp. Ac-20342]NIF77614.1 hypothetical protein [Paraburkholderia sp. Cy-641]